MYTFFGVLYVRKKRKFYLKIARFLIAVAGLTTIGWLIMGSVVRFNDSGTKCSENILYKSGKFIKVYLILMYTVLSLFMCYGVLGCLIMKPAKSARLGSEAP